MCCILIGLWAFHADRGSNTVGCSRIQRQSSPQAHLSRNPSPRGHFPSTPRLLSFPRSLLLLSSSRSVELPSLSLIQITVLCSSLTPLRQDPHALLLPPSLPSGGLPLLDPQPIKPQPILHPTLPPSNSRRCRRRAQRPIQGGAVLVQLSLADLRAVSVLGRGAKGVVFHVVPEGEGGAGDVAMALKSVSREAARHKKSGGSGGVDGHRRIWFERDVLPASAAAAPPATRRRWWRLSGSTSSAA